MKYNYIIFAFLIYCIFPLSFGKGRGVVFAQQLSPRYMRTGLKVTFSKDTAATFEAAVPTSVNGQLIGVANGKSPHGGPPVSGGVFDIFPYLYRMDSTGKYTSLKAFKFGTFPSNYTFFDKAIPYKDSIYILGRVSDDVSSGKGFSGGSAFVNQMILKTDSAGNVAWKHKWGDPEFPESINDATICSDGGIAFCGDVELGRLPDSTGTWTYFGHKSSIAKYNANGTLLFNKSFQIPFGIEPARMNLDFSAIAESPTDKGYMVAGWGFEDSRRRGPSIDATGLFLMKLDANGNKLWDKAVMNDRELQPMRSLEVADMIPHPTGGYILVGHTNIAEWDPTITSGNTCEMVKGQLRCYNYIYTGGLMMKISEQGDIEWIKSFRYKVAGTAGSIGEMGIHFKHITLSSTNGSPTGFILNGSNSTLISSPIYDTLYPFGGGSFYDDQTVLVKTDFNGNLVWNREYGALVDDYTDYDVHEELNGSLIVNSLASPSNTDNYVTAGAQNEKGILRLDAKGFLQDSVCSLSPDLIVYNDDVIVPYAKNITLETTPTAIDESPTLPTVVVSSKPLPAQPTYGICGNPLWANFNYSISCSASGTGASVIFTNNSRGGALYHYDFGDQISGEKNFSDSANVQHLYSTNGTYTVSLTVWDGDSSKPATVKKTFTIVSRRQITITPGNTTICQGATVKLEATINSGYLPEGIYINEKNNKQSKYASTSSDSTYNSLPLDTTLIFFMDGYGNKACAVSDTVVITVLPSVNMGVRGENTTLCIGDSALLIASGSKTYLWNPENTTNDSLMAHPIGTITYTVSSGQSTVCGTNTASIKVIVNSKPIVEAGTDQTIYPGKQASLLASGGVNYIWSPALGLNSASIANPTADPGQTTIYYVTATDINGCVGCDSITVYLKTCGVDLFVPNAFSPNDDNENDVFYIKTLNNDCIQSIEIKVFDRWGNKVFTSTDINLGWNGYYKGKAMDTETFVYFLNATFETGEIVTQKGNLSLIR